MKKRPNTTILSDPQRHWFPIEMELCYQCLNGGRVSASGVGQTIEISSNEIRFTAQHDLKVDDRMQLAVKWPVMLNNTSPLKLEVFGRIILGRLCQSALKIDRYEFRTRGAQLMVNPNNRLRETRLAAPSSYQ